MFSWYLFLVCRSPVARRSGQRLCAGYKISITQYSLAAMIHTVGHVSVFFAGLSLFLFLSCTLFFLWLSSLSLSIYLSLFIYFNFACILWPNCKRRHYKLPGCFLWQRTMCCFAHLRSGLRQLLHLSLWLCRSSYIIQSSCYYLRAICTKCRKPIRHWW